MPKHHAFRVVLFTSLLLFISCTNNSDDLSRYYAKKKGSYPLVTKHLDEQQTPLFINRLIKQDSLYLLQHAHNPVQWWSWGDDAFAAAREQDKPILLSIGYSTCHWCHVMARESFEDIEIANYINEHFIAIKVDREEHPDVDELYLTAVQMLSGQAGWPLTAILTPKGQPFFGGTYFSPSQFSNRLSKVNGAWLERREAVMEQAERLEMALNNINKSNKNANAINSDVINEAVARIQRSFANGEPGPGFPREPEILFLVNQATHSLSKETIATIEQRLKKLAASGLHDQVGGGFHRYTVGADLRIPHFEKMLYNQAQMGQAYFRAYRLSGNPQLQAIGESTFAYLLNDMQSPNGGFYAAMDAESEEKNGQKSEGAYYIWSYETLKTLLNDRELALARDIFDASPQGNFNGSIVLQNKSLENINPYSQNYSATQIDAVLNKLNTARQERKPPSTDTKIITAWNSMAISALLSGYHANKNEGYRGAAIKAAQRLWDEAYTPKAGLARTIPNGKQRVPGTLEDYAYFANSLIDLYDLEGKQSWLDRAQQITQHMLKHFKDSNTGGFLISSNKAQKNLIVSLVTARDDAISSGNSMAAQTLARLYRRTGNTDYRQAARDVISAFSTQLLANPESLSGMLVAANLLNQSEITTTQYAAKSKVTLKTTLLNQQLKLNIDIEPGWHINASRVLDAHLIPTTLSAVPDHCSSLSKIHYPEGNIVSLGFQDDDLLVYEDSITITADLPANELESCAVTAAQLRIQACSDEVCQSPETLDIRAF